jgi:hypothetical protein
MKHFKDLIVRGVRNIHDSYRMLIRGVKTLTFVGNLL